MVSQHENVSYEIVARKSNTENTNLYRWLLFEEKYFLKILELSTLHTEDLYVLQMYFVNTLLAKSIFIFCTKFVGKLFFQNEQLAMHWLNV